MGWEYAALRGRPEVLRYCPECGDEPFRSFMRGQVASYWRKFFKRPYCCIICTHCKKIVGYERP